MVARLSSSQEDLSPMTNSASSSNMTALQEELNIIGAGQDSDDADGDNNV